LIPNVRRTWAPRGQTPIVRHRYQRDKVSAISAITVTAQHRRVGFYLHLHPAANITTAEVAVFLRGLLRHLRGQVIVMLDRGSIHKGPEVQALQARCPRLHLEWFPGYAPELNPAEWVWSHFKAELANGQSRHPRAAHVHPRPDHQEGGQPAGPHPLVHRRLPATLFVALNVYYLCTDQ
jgi:transposase